MTIRILFIAFLISGTILSQENKRDTIAAPSKISFEAGLIYPLYIGDNAAGQTYDFSVGFEAGITAHIKHSWYVQLSYSRTTFEVENQATVGFYDEGSVHRAKVLAKYRKEIGKGWQVSASLGTGYVDFSNKSESEKFHDTGFSIYAGVELAYTNWNFMQLFMAVDGNVDFLNTETSSQIQGIFNRAYAITPKFGIRF
jgi:hypothetical protein